MSTDPGRGGRRHGPWIGFWLSVAAGAVVWLWLLWILGALAGVI